MVHFHDKLLVKKQPLVHSVGIGPKLVLLTKTRVSNKKKRRAACFSHKMHRFVWKPSSSTWVLEKALPSVIISY